MGDDAAQSWDREYATGRYLGDPPVAFVEDILTAARVAGFQRGLYIGCGNGRNYLPLVRGGLDLIGLDISRRALQQLAERAPDVCDYLICGDLYHLPPDGRYDLVIGLQVFQHGTRSIAHAHIEAAQQRVRPGGLMAVRVNATGTDLVLQHEVIERGQDGGFTIRYLEGPKEGLEIHFFSRSELDELFAQTFQPVLPARLQSTDREPPASGRWCQWEAIWRRMGSTVAG
jgi:SAM-dependent methyltransferase